MQQLDSNSQKVNSYFESLGKMPMGKYFEQLLFFILEYDERYEIVLKNHQIVDKKHTVGEIDLILKDTVSGRIGHWELCLKYYLQKIPSVDHEVMLGPNAIDSLDRKMKKLIDHQLTLGNHPKVIELIQSQPIESKLFMKGQFFYHLNNSNIFPKDSNPAHEQGWWCHLSEAEEMLNSDLIWTTIWKPDWIGPTLRYQDAELLSNTQLINSLQNHFQKESHSVFCVGLKEQNGTWSEASRGFVVNNNWPTPNRSAG